jgi:hypothetical protein
MIGRPDIGQHVAQAVTEATGNLPAGTQVDLQTLRLDLPHDAGPEEIRQAVLAALLQERLE